MPAPSTLARLLLAVALFAVPSQVVRAQDQLTLQVDAETRSYIRVVPDGVALPAPMLLFLHGGGGRARRLAGSDVYGAIAERAGWVVLYPDGDSRSWNSSLYPDRALVRRNSGADDMGFLTRLIDLHVREGFARPDAVFMAGISRGALMTSRFACDRADLLAGFGLIIGTQHLENPCRPARPVAAFFMHGTADRLIPYAGEQEVNGGVTVGLVGVEALVADWRGRNGCSGTARSGRHDRDGDRVWAEQLDWTCATPTRQLVIHGGGHAPAEPTDVSLPRWLVGEQSRDISTIDQMIALFSEVLARR